MSEVMALEKIVELWLKSEGHWTETRVPFKKPSGANSDVDVIGIKLNGKKAKVVVVEVKGHGSPSAFPNYGSPGRTRGIKRLCSKEKKDLKSFLRSDFAKQFGIKRVDEVRLVEPGRLPHKRAELEHRLRQELRLPFVLRIYSVDEVIQLLWEWVIKNKDIRRKRYADTSLEMIRWILRSGRNIEWAAKGVRSGDHAR